ncbi:AraC family transcriptional regulator [Gracilibacillus oryzae]|uniref:AraC family transcriptional regulator n=1 Tax=Gracilibacillus oryzae TaxID=1672701 RepID=A0A7C8KM68_9BACI|nr:AraC family transcriptional regulator [Gracilibacillus oryzae]KAB8125766.1 AraC family transcriptional regulator [Gracilibacillus oryzae]
MKVNNSYGFHLKGSHQNRVAGIHTIGKEIRTEESYRWNGLERGEEGRVVFQYTLSGKGAIRIKEKTYTLSKEQAFLVHIPSDHCYFLPAESEHWEFIYITLFGDEAVHYYEFLKQEYGQILQMPMKARPIKHIYRLLEKIETTGISHAYEASGYAYSFLMECMQYFEHDLKKDEELPIAIAKSVTFMEKNFSEDISLSDIVQVSGLSKYHFTRLFSKTMGETPIQFLTRIRIQYAADLLQQRKLSVEEIAKKVGYTNGNYFSKVFKSILNVTPSEYRNNQSFMPVDRLFID